MSTKLNNLLTDFYALRESSKGKQRIKKDLFTYENKMEEYLSRWMALSKEDKHVYPSQGLLLTPHDYLTYHAIQMLPQEKIVETLRMRWFFLTMFNHPARIYHLKKINSKKFTPPPIIKSKLFSSSDNDGLSLSIGDIGARVTGSEKPRTSRTERYAQGPFIKLGKQARSIFVGSASPDVWNSAAAIATMAASHCLSCIPRNGVTSDLKRQTDLAKEVFSWLKDLENTLLDKRADKKEISNYWKSNVMGTLSANPEKALGNAKALYKAGVRTFRIYSPEPGTGTVESVKILRKEFGKNIEIFAGMIIDLSQAAAIEEAGADGLYAGIGGGGRCTTGVRSGSVIDWPELIWSLRGKVNIPVIVEGGASDHVASTLLLGASGIGVSRAVSGGTIESPGGALYCVDKIGKLFKPYGGEASARTKYLDGKLMPFNIPAFVEGETTKAQMSYVDFVLPTLTYNLHLLTEDVILSLVFRNAESIYDLQAIDPSPLRRYTSFGEFQRNTH